MSTRRGSLTVIVLAAVAAAALVFGGGLSLPSFLQKKPPTAQLDTAQRDLAAAKAAQAAAEAALATVRAQEEAKKREQVIYAQEMATGAANAIARVPEAARVAEVKLAGELLDRTVGGLAAAIGALPADKQAEIVRLVAGALSAKQTEVDAARAALAAKDAELKVAAIERAQLAAKVPALEAAVQTKAAEVAVHEVTVAAKVAEVERYANTAAAERAKSGSLSAYAGKIERVLIGLVALYVLFVFFVPGVVKHLDAGWFKTSLRNVAGYVTSGLLFHDAKKKLAALAEPPKP